MHQVSETAKRSDFLRGIALNVLRGFSVGLLLLGTLAVSRGVAAAPAQIHASPAAAGFSAQPPAYTLPPDKLGRAEALDRDENWMWMASTVWGFASLYLVLRLRVVAALRDRAQRVAARPWLVGFLFLPMLLLLLRVLALPLSVAGHHIGLAYGLSIERWRPWLWDWSKGLMISVFSGTLILSLLFAIVRHARRTWWLWFWLASLPLIAGSVYLVPLVIDPLFNHFEPLSQSHPELVEQLERVVQKSGESIPPQRMFLMRASEKTTGINAYVTGFGGSKRVVVWDTALSKATPDDVTFIFGHELGHFVLGDVWHGMLLGAAGLLLALWLGYYAVCWSVRRFGASWGIMAVEDWGTVAVLMLIFAVFGFASDPVTNLISRATEHRADVYGQEIVHGIVADPQTTGVHSFQVLGEIWLEVPRPNRLMVFWTYNHPPTLERAEFAREYDPWAPGSQPRFFPR